MLLTDLGDDVLCHIAKAMVTPTSISPTKIQERHFHDVWNFSRCNRYLHDLLWPEDQGYWQQIVAVHGSGRLDTSMTWRRVGLKLMKEEKVAHKAVFCPRRSEPGYLTQPPEWAIKAIKSRKPPSPSFWDRPVIAKAAAAEWNIPMTTINDPNRKVLPDYRLLSMPCLTEVEVVVCREVPALPTARSSKPTMAFDHFIAQNPDGLMIGDIEKAFEDWFPTAKSAHMVQLRKDISNGFSAVTLLPAQSTALLRTWPFSTINGGRVLAMLRVRTRSYRPHPYPNQQIINEVDGAFGEDDDMDNEDEFDPEHDETDEEEELDEDE